MKNSLKVFAVIVFAITLFLNVSFDSSGHFKFVSQAHAVNGTWRTYTGTCPNKTTITVCGQGSDASCTPKGSCP